MLWLNKHARIQNQLSPYIDGQLSPRGRAALDDHLAVCEACRLRLDELRATISAAGGLDEVEPPRSFALTPRMLERRQAALPVPASPLATGMRVASAGVALALAVVVVGDLGGVGGGMNDSSDESGAARDAVEFQMSESGGDRAAGGNVPEPAATGQAERSAADAPVDTDSPGNLAPPAVADAAEVCPLSGAPASAEASGGGAGAGAGGPGGPVTATNEPSPTAEPAPTPSVSPNLAASSDLTACAPAVAGVPSATEAPDMAALQDRGEFEAAASPESSSDDGDGISALTVLEIVLGGALVALIGAVAIEYTLRRRRAS